MDFDAKSANDQAGIWVFNGLQTLSVRLCSSVDSVGNKIIVFSYKTNYFSMNSPGQSGTTIVLLKLVRAEHVLSGYCSSDGIHWIQVGSGINVADMDGLQSNYNAWTGNRQGLFVQGTSAGFDFYIYRDAYTPILAECPANQFGTTPSLSGTGTGSLDNIHNGDWALYAGVEFGYTDYLKAADSIVITASSVSAGGVVQVWLDSLDTGEKLAECTISSTGSWSTFATFGAKLPWSVTGNYDVYLKFKGAGTDKLFMLQSLVFKDNSHPETSVGELRNGVFPNRFELAQNYPNPFNPTTEIKYSAPQKGYVSLKVYDLLGREVATLFDGIQSPGEHSARFDGANRASGVYFYRLKEGATEATKKLVLLK